MADLLRRNMAPIPAEAWEEIDEQAATILRGNLSARTVMDMQGPQGWEASAINLGGLEVGEDTLVPDVGWGLRKVLPLTEIRVPFELDMWELDDVARGSKTPDLDAVTEAAQKAALFEETAVYKGFAAAGIIGVLEETDNKPIKLSDNPEEFMDALEAGIHAIQKHGVGGPFELVLGRMPYQKLNIGDQKGYPLRRRVQELLGGGIHWSPAIEGGVLLSSRGGDFELTCGQDFSIGFAGIVEHAVKLYLTESFTFRVLEPGAAVELKA
jgi:uncharacterized linocin/CFP29 family protein